MLRLFFNVSARHPGHRDGVLVHDDLGGTAVDIELQAETQIASRMLACAGRTDTVARIGGDEFVILSVGTGDDEQATALVGRLRHALRRPFRVDGASLEIDGSLGWAVFPADGATADELLSRADGQMYATKRDTSEDAILVRRGVDASVIHDVEAALEHDELVVVYQPIIDLQTGEARSAEALVRRLLPDGTLLPPADFVPHVERTPLVRELTFLVISDALRATQLWKESGNDLGVSVNVPYKLVDDLHFVDAKTSVGNLGNQDFSFVGGASRVAKDIPPYLKAVGNPVKLYGLNSVGLQRSNFDPDVIRELKRAYRLFFRSELNVSQALERAQSELSMTPEVKHFLGFVDASQRGVVI